MFISSRQYEKQHDSLGFKDEGTIYTILVTYSFSFFFDKAQCQSMQMTIQLKILIIRHMM